MARFYVIRVEVASQMFCLIFNPILYIVPESIEVPSLFSCISPKSEIAHARRRRAGRPPSGCTAAARAPGADRSVLAMPTGSLRRTGSRLRVVHVWNASLRRV